MSSHTPTWPIDAKKLRTLDQGERFICLFSGGKDCGLALLIAMDTGRPVALAQCITHHSHHSRYHDQPIVLAEKQAAALGIPLYISQASPWDQPAEMIALYRSYAKRGVQSIVFGDLYLDQNARWQAALCEQAGLTPRMPLWQRDPQFMLREMRRRKMQCIITWVNPEKLSAYWLGKHFDEVAYRAFERAGIDPMGENGEFHTTLIDCDRFSHALSLDAT